MSLFEGGRYNLATGKPVLAVLVQVGMCMVGSLSTQHAPLPHPRIFRLMLGSATSNGVCGLTIISICCSTEVHQMVKIT